jgi:tetratricopeptide (TPR) repeat protein
MKLISLEYPYLIKIIIPLIPLIAGSVWYFYYANPFTQHSQLVEEFFNRARQFQMAGNPREAKKEYLQLLTNDPNCAAAHFNLAQIYAGDEEWQPACDHYKKAIEGIDPSNKYLIHFCYGTALFRLNMLKEAKEHLDLSLMLQPSTKAYMQRSLVCQALGELDQAKADLDIAVKDDTSYARGYIDLGNKYRDAHKFARASECYQACSQYMPDFYGAYLLRGDSIHLLSQQTADDTLIPEAMALYEKAIACDATCYQAQLNLALMHMEQNKDERAMELLNQAYKNKQDFPFTNIAKGICHIKCGQLEQGWPGYEWRCALSTTRFDTLPKWDGIKPLKNKTIILHSEQGYGDTLHFIRYAKIAKEKGAYVIVEVQARLKQLISLCPYIDLVITEYDPIPSCDYQLPLLSMPTALKTSFATIPNQMPYLYADNTLVNKWHERLKNDRNFKIGICWQVNSDHDFIKYSNDSVKIQLSVPRRTIALEQFKPLTQLDNVSIYALQFQADPKKCAALNIKTFADLDQTSGPFMDTAAIIKNFDLIITVDTALAHLAGGLGAKTWILLPYAAEWRWFKNRTDSPWYPTARLFRCHQKDAWESCISEICIAIKPLIAAHN